MTPPPLLLGLDIGTSRLKALLVDEAGEGQALAAVPTPFAAGAAGVEMTVDSLRSALADVLVALGAARSRVAAVGVAGVAESGAPVDGRGRALAPVIAWHDPRGAEVVARIEERLGAWLPTRVGQRLRPVSSAAKLGWLLDHGVEGMATWLGVPELCLFQLTATPATEHSLASRTGWYDVTERRYLPEVAEVCGFPPHVLPPVLPAGAVMGRVGDEAARWAGLPRGIPVTVAGHDHLAGAEGVGAGDDAFNSVGTAETVLRRCSVPPDLEEALALRIAVSVRPGGEGWCLLASAARAGSVLERAARALGRSPAELDELAARAGTGSGDGAASAGDGDAARGAAHELVDRLRAGENVDLSGAPPGEVWAGLLGALAARTAEAYERTTRLAGPAPRVVAFGGGSRSGAWMREKAAVLPVPLFAAAVAEAVAWGAAVTAGVAAGWWGHVVDRPSPVLEPVPPP